MIKKSTEYFPHLITKLVPTFMILTTFTASYSSAIANDKLPALQLNKISFKQTATKQITKPLTKEFSQSSETLNTEQIKQVAKQQNATIVQYSIIADESVVNGKTEAQKSELYIWVIKPTGDVQFRKVDLKALGEIEKNSFLNLFKRHRRNLGARSEVTKGVKLEYNPNKNFSRTDLQKLHQVLIKPIADLLPQKPNEPLIFIPQGELFSVPFAALQDKEGKYLIEKHTISTAPSVQILDLLYQRKNKGKGEQSFIPTNITGNELLIVGNPTAPKTPFKTGKEICKVPPLPGFMVI